MLLLATLGVALAWPAATAQDLAPEVIPAARFNTSVPLRAMPLPPINHRSLPPAVVPNRFHNFDKPARNPGADRPDFADPVLDAGRGSAGPGTVLESFDGVSAAETIYVPPDTNGDVGPDHYVQWINGTAKVYDKAGTVVLGPVPGTFFFQGLGGPCESQNDGDPIVLYDHLADCWVAMQFQLTVGFDLCMAVSVTPDPTGAYHQYEFDFENFPDYPKISVWPDAYYATTRSLGSGLRVEAIAFERAAMLEGQPANMVKFLVPLDGSSFTVDGYLPADLDGPPPPAGTPGPFVGGPEAPPQDLRLFGLEADWGTPSASTFTLLDTLTPAPYDNLVIITATSATARRSCSTTPSTPGMTGRACGGTNCATARATPAAGGASTSRAPARRTTASNGGLGRLR
ncbi:MAG: hypothetical protein AAGI91_03415 [Bacteroidota bacterium]